jgi:hypothetical protein
VLRGESDKFHVIERPLPLVAKLPQTMAKSPKKAACIGHSSYLLLWKRNDHQQIVEKSLTFVIFGQKMQAEIPPADRS